MDERYHTNNIFKYPIKSKQNSLPVI